MSAIHALLCLVALTVVGTTAAHATPAPTLETLPALLQGAEPRYPEAALAAGRGGDVDLQILINAVGSVERVAIVHLPVDAAGVVDAISNALGDAALGAATNFVFEPASFCVAADDGAAPICGQHLLVNIDYRLGFSPPIAALVVPTFSVGGVVTDARTRQPLGDVEVSLEPSDADDVADDHSDHSDAVALSDEDGHFVVVGVPAGTHRFSFGRSGYEPLFIDEVVTADVNTVVALAPREHTGEAVIRRRRPPHRADMQSSATLDSAQLQRIRGRSLAATIVEIPGVTMLQSGPQVAKPVVRGQFGRRLLTLFDGVLHEGQDWGVDHAPEVDPFAAGSVTVVRGPAGVRYGPDAIGGVVLVEPRPLRDTVGIDGSVDLVGVDNGRIGTIAARIDAVPEFLPALTLRIEANASKGAAVSSPDYVLGNTGSEVENLGVTLGYRTPWAGGDLTARASYRHLQQTLGICFCLQVTTPAELTALLARGRPISADDWTTTYDIGRPRQEVAHDIAALHGTAEFGGAGTLSLTYAFQLDRRDEYDHARRSVTVPQFSFDLRTHAVDLAFEQARTTGGRFGLGGTLGAHLDVQEHSYTGLQLIPNYRRYTGGVFAIERLSIGHVGIGDLELEAGARYDLRQQTAFLAIRAFSAQVRRGRIAADGCDVTDDAARCDTAASALTFTTGARWAIDLGAFNNALTVKGDASSATRFPDVDELYLGGRAPSFPVLGLGDAGLQPETTYQTSLSASVALPMVSFEASAFASYTHNYIAFGPELDDTGAPVVDVLITGTYPRFSYAAVEAVLSGVDGGVVIAPGALLSGTAQVSCVQARNLSTGGALPFIAPAQSRLEVLSNLPEAFGLHESVVGANAVLVATQGRFDRGSDFTPPPPGYALFGLRASTALGPTHLGVEVKNLFDQRYRDSMSLLRFFADQPGREIWLRFNIELDGPLPDRSTTASTS